MIKSHQETLQSTEKVLVLKTFSISRLKRVFEAAYMRPAESITKRIK